MPGPDQFLDLSATNHPGLFQPGDMPWSALGRLASFLTTHLPRGNRYNATGPSFFLGRVHVGEGTVIEPGVFIRGPVVIGRNCLIRHSATLRDNVVIGDNCVIGHATEIKHSIVFHNCEVPHFNYVGDSILGRNVHLGAGVRLSNVRLLPGPILVDFDGQRLDSGLAKFGAVVGDGAEIGCNAVLNPGSLIGRRAVILPNVSWRGHLPENAIARPAGRPEVVLSPRRPTP